MDKHGRKKPKRKPYDKARSKTRVNIASAFQRWRELRVREGLQSDADVAFFLLDRVCGEPSSTSPGKRRQSQKSTAEPALHTKATPRDSPQHSWDQLSDTESQSSPEPQSPPIKVRRICHDLPSYQLDEQTEDESDLDDIIDLAAPSYSFAPPSPSTDEDSETQWGEIKDEIAQTAQRLEERLEAMRSLSVEALEPISMTGRKADHEEVTWMSNKSSLTGLFRTCHQCGEPIREFKTLMSGSLSRIQWECSKGHLMWLFHNYNPP